MFRKYAQEFSRVILYILAGAADYVKNLFDIFYDFS